MIILNKAVASDSEGCQEALTCWKIKSKGADGLGLQVHCPVQTAGTPRPFPYKGAVANPGPHTFALCGSLSETMSDKSLGREFSFVFFSSTQGLYGFNLIK